MGSLFRSEEMALCQLYLQTEAAYSCLSELGELGLFQFRDLNPDVSAFQRKFVNEIRRCDEMERKLRYIEKEIKKDGISIPVTERDPDVPAPREMIDLEATFESLDNNLREVNANTEALRRNFLELTELNQVLEKAVHFFAEAMVDPSMSGDTLRLLGEDSLQSGSLTLRLGFVSGVIRRESVPSFERVLYRACRGNAFLKQSWIEIPLVDPATGEEVAKSAFLVLFQGEQLKMKVKKICEGFRATLYPCPETAQDRLEMSTGVATRIADLTLCRTSYSSRDSNMDMDMSYKSSQQTRTINRPPLQRNNIALVPFILASIQVFERRIPDISPIPFLLYHFNTQQYQVLNKTEDHRRRLLVEAAKNVKMWFIKVCKIKAIYYTLNMFNLDVTTKCLIGEGWCPVSDLDRIQLALQCGTEHSGSTAPSVVNRMVTTQTLPTYNRTNKFTSVFQSIVDSYGVADYREVNPAPFAIITFPFLFAVMFGDLGHGLIMMLFGLWMVLRERQLIAKGSNNEIWNIFFGGRYIILMMGAFSIYSGLLYNDAFSKSLNIFGSSWSAERYNLTTIKHKMIQLDPNTTDYSGEPYPFGMDPVWQLAINKINFHNSFKMKLSVIFGISQMLFGVLLSCCNFSYFKKQINIYCEFIPQLLFLLVIFMYLVILIFYKWIAFDADSSAHAPSLLIHLAAVCIFYSMCVEITSPSFKRYFINMFLMKYPSGMFAPPSAVVFYPYQQPIQIILIVVAVLCIIWMLFLKPLALRYKYKKSGDVLLSTEDNQTADTSRTYSAEGTSDVVLEDFPQHHQPASSFSQPEEQFDFGEVLITQAIHTIEYCLGMVSHTASYLRLWALSLAHTELSEVLWTMVLRIGFSVGSTTAGYTGSIIIFLVFIPWAGLTVGVLLMMEGLSAFLHTLRLHWVEFQSKFYQGTGYKFQPFSFENIIEVEMKEAST